MSAPPSQPQRQSLRFYKAFFEVHDAERTHARVLAGGAVEMSGADDGAWEDRWYWWHENASSSSYPAASFLIRLRRQRMVLEGPTAESVGRGWRALDKLVRPHAEARVAAGDDLQRFLPSKRAHSGDRPESWSREHENKVLAEFYAAFCVRWATTPHGRLDGKTPREAARDESLRSRLESLLERMDRLDQERRARRMPGFSVQELRAAVHTGG